ncbi:hypothetical protein BC833DRAFT_626711 [Globomyces pollinis-pini]|nr:hypothetical protein BC833DRAFT_626711 [Globomyces pollinis-pini]
MSKSRKLPDAKELVKRVTSSGQSMSVQKLFLLEPKVYLKFYGNGTITTSLEQKMELLKLDLISRTLCISDSTTNSGNFGYCNAEKKGYIIDFDLMERFLNGNGEFNYTEVMSEAINIFTKEEKLL